MIMNTFIQNTYDIMKHRSKEHTKLVNAKKMKWKLVDNKREIKRPYFITILKRQ
jgi:hypothetical protein